MTENQTLPNPEPRYMSTLDDQADQIMHTAAVMVAREIAAAHKIAEATLTDPVCVPLDDEWAIHDRAIEIFKQIAPKNAVMDRPAIGDTEVRYFVWDVVRAHLETAGLADHYGYTS